MKNVFIVHRFQFTQDQDHIDVTVLRTLTNLLKKHFKSVKSPEKSAILNDSELNLLLHRLLKEMDLIATLYTRDFLPPVPGKMQE
jgi:hypothetical protein